MRLGMDPLRYWQQRPQRKICKRCGQCRGLGRYQPRQEATDLLVLADPCPQFSRSDCIIRRPRSGFSRATEHGGEEGTSVPHVAIEDTLLVGFLLEAPIQEERPLHLIGS